MKIYKSLNNLFEQPFFKEIVEIFKFFKLQKTYWSVVFVLVFFVLGQISSLSIGEQIEKFTQSQLQKETINFLEKIFWYAFEFIFANGSWWGLGIGIILFGLVSLVRVYEVKFSNNATQKFEPNLEWAKEKIEISLKNIGNRYITYNKKEYESLNQRTDIQNYIDIVINTSSILETDLSSYMTSYVLQKSYFEDLQKEYIEFVDYLKDCIGNVNKSLDEGIKYLLELPVLETVQCILFCISSMINGWNDPAFVDTI